MGDGGEAPKPGPHIFFMLVFTFTISGSQASAVTAARCTQTVCDMIRNSIYRCYGIIPTIKELLHLPNDLGLASRHTRERPDGRDFQHTTGGL